MNAIIQSTAQETIRCHSRLAQTLAETPFDHIHDRSRWIDAAVSCIPWMVQERGTHYVGAGKGTLPQAVLFLWEEQGAVVAQGSWPPDTALNILRKK
eukprot:1157628-Pelagomonas_calceolata.AAC.7